jgi:starch synthase
VLEALVTEFGSVDLVHCHDWQAGLIPAWLATGAYRYPSLRATASVTTIHNLAYQGRFPKSLFGFTGLGEERFNLHELEFFGDFSLLKAAIVYADAITTVSPTYAKEIQTAEHGCGLEGVLQSRQHLLHGIVNGVDLAIWDCQSVGRAERLGYPPAGLGRLAVANRCAVGDRRDGRGALP